MKAFIILYYGAEAKKPQVFYQADAQAMFEEIIHLTKKKALFAIYELGECVGDFS